MSGTEEGPRFVMVADAETQECYPEQEFVDAFSDAFLGHLAAAIPQDSTARTAARAVVKMKQESRHQQVLRSACTRLRRAPGTTADEVHRSGGSIVATFPV